MTQMKWRNQLFYVKNIGGNGSRTAEEEELQKNEERGKWDEVKNGLLNSNFGSSEDNEVRGIS